jgi:hypothetical protein
MSGDEDPVVRAGQEHLEGIRRASEAQRFRGEVAAAEQAARLRRQAEEQLTGSKMRRFIERYVDWLLRNNVPHNLRGGMFGRLRLWPVGSYTRSSSYKMPGDDWTSSPIAIVSLYVSVNGKVYYSDKGRWKRFTGSLDVDATNRAIGAFLVRTNPDLLNRWQRTGPKL